MTRPRGAMARRVALSAADRRRVSLTSHEAAAGPGGTAGDVPAAAVASLDNGALRRDPAARRRPKRCGVGDLPLPAPEPELPPEADRLAVPETDLTGEAAEVWRDVIAAGDGDALKRGKARKQIERTLRGAGLYLFVSAGMHAAGTAKKAKGRAAGAALGGCRGDPGPARGGGALPGSTAGVRRGATACAGQPRAVAGSGGGVSKRGGGGGGVIAVDHLLSDGRGSQPVTVTVCRTCEAADPDFNRLRSAGGLPFYYGIHRGRAGAGR